MRAAKLQPGGSDEGKWLVGKAASSQAHDFVVKDENFSSLLSTTSLVLIGQPQKSQIHVVLAIGHDFNLPQPWAEACVPGKPARELFTDGPTSAALEASWHDKEAFCSSVYSRGGTESDTLLCSVPVPSQASGLEEAAETSPSHVLMLKPPGTPEPDPGGDSLSTLKGWAACLCVVRVPADLDENEPLVIQAASRRFAQEAGFPIPTLLDACLTALCGPGTKESSIKALLRMVQACVTGERSLDKSNPAAKKGCDILFYRRSGEPWIANVRAMRCPTAAGSSKETPEDPSKENGEGSKTESRSTSFSCILSIANVTAAACPVVGDITLGRVLGSGAFGTVHIGKQKGFESTVAVKVVNCRTFRDLRDLDAMRNEISVMATLRHPHIIDLLDSAYVGDRIFIVLEFAPGGDLMEYMRAQEDGKLQEQEAKRVFGQCVSALLFCQRKRICHRDLKPENILLDMDQNVKIADFGLASIVTPGSQLLEYCGTPAFSAPELFGKEHYGVDPADVWSLGVVLYECLTGVMPFKGANQAALVKKICSGKYPALPESLSPDVRDLVGRMLVVDPEARINIDEITTHDWYMPPAGGGGGSCIKELSLAVPEDDVGADDPVNDAVESPAGGSTAASPLCPSPPRRLKHLHSSVLVTLDDPDFEAGEDQESTMAEPATSPSQAALNGSSPKKSNLPDAIDHGAAAVLPAGTPKFARGKSTSGLESIKPGAGTGKGRTAQELKANTRKARGAHFADIPAAEDDVKAREEVVHLPKLEASKRRAASMGGGLVGNGGTTKSAAVSSTGAAGDESRVAGNRLPSARRPRAVSYSSPGGISSEAPQKGQRPKGCTRGIPALP